MAVIRQEGNFPSATGICDIFYRAWLPSDGEIKAVVQISHGMAEHGERYEDFAKTLCDNGYALYVNDHAGHGRSVKSDDDLGYFGENDGWAKIVEDIKSMTDIIRNHLPGKPVILYGHSMGSFVARDYVTKYGDLINAAVFCGTSGPNPAAGAGIIIAGLTAKIKGGHYRSKFINNIAFGSYNKKYDSVRTEFDWLTRDNAIVDEYIGDKYCGFLFTACGFKDMFTLLKTVSTRKWANSVPKALPILIVSGAMDPVGGFGKGVTAVNFMLRESGHDKLTFKLYDGDRHEILNEINRAEVYADIITWLDSAVG